MNRQHQLVDKDSQLKINESDELQTSVKQVSHDAWDEIK